MALRVFAELRQHDIPHCLVERGTLVMPLLTLTPVPQVYIERFWYNCNFRLSRNNEANAVFYAPLFLGDLAANCMALQILVCQSAMAECDRWLERFDALEAGSAATQLETEDKFETFVARHGIAWACTEAILVQASG